MKGQFQWSVNHTVKAGIYHNIILEIEENYDELNRDGQWKNFFINCIL